MAPLKRGYERSGVTTVFLVIIVVIIIFALIIGIYIALGRGTSVTSTHSTNTSTSSLLINHSTSSTSILTTFSTSSSTVSGVITYTGTFNFSLALGPSGERLSSNNTVETYASTISGVGTFTFSINAINSSGTGNGQGVLTVKTIGFCSGSTTFPYTFTIPDATTLLGNLTVFIGTPLPSEYTVPLTCTGSISGVNTATNNPGSFLAVYPNEISVSSVPTSVNQTQSGGISYSYTISQSS